MSTYQNNNTWHTPAGRLHSYSNFIYIRRSQRKTSDLENNVWSCSKPDFSVFLTARLLCWILDRSWKVDWHFHQNRIGHILSSSSMTRTKEPAHKHTLDKSDIWFWDSSSSCCEQMKTPLVWASPFGGKLTFVDVTFVLFVDTNLRLAIPFTRFSYGLRCNPAKNSINLKNMTTFGKTGTASGRKKTAWTFFCWCKSELAYSFNNIFERSH